MSHVAVGGHAARLARRPSAFELSGGSSPLGSGGNEDEAAKQLDGGVLLGTLREKHQAEPLQRGMRVALDGLSYTVRLPSRPPLLSHFANAKAVGRLHSCGVPILAGAVLSVLAEPILPR